jgi:hypothetical protein
MVEVLPRLVAWLLIAALAISLAWWTWRVLPLQTMAPAREMVRPQVSALATQGWFAGSAAEPGKQASSGRYVLRWTYPGAPGVCILGLPGLADKAFKVGDEIEPGFILREVGDDYASIEGGGGLERLVRVREKAPPAQAAGMADGSGIDRNK